MAGAVALLGGLLALAGSASAQTGYPAGPCTATVSSAALGSFTPGNVLTITLAPVCAFTPGTPVTVTVNGQNVGTKTSTANGVVTVEITIVNATTLSVDDPVIVPAVCGTNTVVARGTSAVANNATVTHTVTFGVICPTPVAQTTATPARVAFTGANVLRASAVALALLLSGALLVVATRRRRSSVSAG